MNMLFKDGHVEPISRKKVVAAVAADDWTWSHWYRRLAE